MAKEYKQNVFREYPIFVIDNIGKEFDDGNQKT